MPPSSIFTAFDKAHCTRVQLSTTLKIGRATLLRLRDRSRGKPAQLWFAKVYAGTRELKIGHSGGLIAGRKGEYVLEMRWFTTTEDPPPELRNADILISVLQQTVGEREVDVLANFVFSTAHLVSVFKPVDLGPQSQLFDEIVGFTGVKKDPEGKFLYSMQISVTDKALEHKLSFRQTIKLSDDMVIPLVETASKISALAIKRKEAQ